MSTSAHDAGGGAGRDPEALLASHRARPRSRWRALGALVVALVVLRLAVPIVVAPWLAARLSRALGARVQVGDVSFAPIDAVVTLNAVTVQAPGAAAGDTPVIAAGRVRIDLQWLPLLHHAVLVRELALESARIDVERLGGGGSPLDVFADADPASGLPAGWTFALDRIVLRDTRLRIPGAVTGEPAPLEVALHDARVSTLPRRATAFGRAPNLHVDAVMDGGRVQIDGSSDLTDEGLVVDARVRARDVPLTRLRSYASDLGWTGVAGRVSGRLHYQRAPGRRDVLSGRLLGRGIAVHVPTLVEPALAIPKAVLDVDTIDLRARRVAIGALTVRGTTLAARADSTAPIPLLDGMRGSADTVPPPRGGGTLPREADGGATAWRWKIGRFEAPAARVRVGEGDGAVVLSASVSAEGLGPDAYWSPLRASIHGGAGVAAFDGTVHMAQGLTIDGRLTAGGIDVPAFARAVDMPWSDLVQAGQAALDLNVELAAEAADGPPLGVQGTVGVTDLWLAGPDANAFAIGADAVHFQLTASAPGGNDARPRGASGLRISNVIVGAPYVLLTRAAAGWLLPAVEPPAGPPIVVDRVIAHGGRVLILDQAAKPAADLDIAVSVGRAGGLRLPTFGVGEFTLAGTDRRLGALQLVAIQDVQGRRLEISGRSVPLAATTPYFARAGVPYRFRGGSGDFLARIAFGPEGWVADTTLTLREPSFAADEAAQREWLGMPAEAALAALRDPNGDATLHLTFASQRDGVTHTVPDVVSAVRAAIARAGESPIPDAPFEVTFAAGRSEPTTEGARQIAKIAELLEARSDLVVSLAARPSTDDRHWLAAQALADEEDEGRDFMGILRVFGVRGARERIRRALEARADGRPGRLDADDEAALADLVAQREPLDADRLAALGAARVTRVTDELAARYAIARERVVLSNAEPDESSAPPAVGARIVVDVRAPRGAGSRAGRRRRRRRRGRLRPAGSRRRMRIREGEAAC